MTSLLSLLSHPTGTSLDSEVVSSKLSVQTSGGQLQGKLPWLGIGWKRRGWAGRGRTLVEADETCACGAGQPGSCLPELASVLPTVT